MPLGIDSTKEVVSEVNAKKTVYVDVSSSACRANS
jgi:hypothetical protein